jgi:16S rRNA (adenine1518-N6/adenine1519-N6)-dimethyltransferase
MTAPDARTLLKKYGRRAKKSWGQNFLVDERAYQAIVDACDPDESTWVVEIGAGLGTLTYRLAERAGHVIAVERDRDMVAVLRSELGENPKIEIAEANALTYDYAALAPHRPVVVGNLPYQIASPILFRLLDARAGLRRIVVMLQKEMVDRIVARPGTPEYGALSVMVQMYGTPKLVVRVRAGGFVPAPKVDSAVLKIDPFAAGTRVPVCDEALFSKVVHAAFNQRRKTLRNAIKGFDGSDAALAATGIDGQRRGETLSVEEFAKLTDAIHGSVNA